MFVCVYVCVCVCVFVYTRIAFGSNKSQAVPRIIPVHFPESSLKFCLRRFQSAIWKSQGEDGICQSKSEKGYHDFT